MLFAVRFAALTAVVVLLFTVVNASQSLMVGLANGAFLFGLAAVPLLTRWSRWPSMGGHVLAGTLLAMMAALCLLKGGLLSSPTGWLAAGVFVAVLAVGPRCSVPWVVGLSALLVGLGGHAAERPWPDDLGSVPVYVLSRIAAVWFAWAVASLLEFERAGAYASLMRRREETQLLLDQAAQGFLAIDRHGQVGEQVSEPVHRWLGERPASGALVDWLAHGDPRRAALVRDALENLADGFMPEAVCLQQMSGPLTIGPLRLELTVRPLPAADGYLVVLTDHTEAQARAEAEAVSRQTVQLLDRLHSDRRGTLRVIEEMEQMFADLTARPDGDDAMRLLHTLKGNALVFGLAELSQEAHALEDASAESGELSPVEVRTLHNGWRRIVRGVAPLLVPTGHLDVRVDDVDALEEAVATGQPMTEVAALLERLRQEPADSSLQFLRRAAEELAGELGKRVRVRSSGGDVYLDPARWTGVFAVVPHLLRNALDHGIEPEAERRAVGKAPVGRLEVLLERTSTGTRLVVSDDGRGVDWDAVRAAAWDHGLPTYTDDHLLRALFHEGLSTRSSVDEMSGRGVGTSAVLAAVEDVGGSVKVRSTPGEGTRVVIDVPEVRHAA